MRGCRQKLLSKEGSSIQVDIKGCELMLRRLDVLFKDGAFYGNGEKVVKHTGTR